MPESHPSCSRRKCASHQVDQRAVSYGRSERSPNPTTDEQLLALRHYVRQLAEAGIAAAAKQ